MMTRQDLRVPTHGAALGGQPLLFVGNGPYRNRGCEAIVRGTMEILSDTFGVDLSVRAGVMASPEAVRLQAESETDPRITHFSVSQVGQRFSRKWWLAQANKHLGTVFQHHVDDLHPHLAGGAIALQVGGDNYSLDYGRPLAFMAIDRMLKRHNVPVIIWGASVGPFDDDPDFAPQMFEHLRNLDGIFVREPISRDYLARNGIEANLHQMADPAFLLPALAPLDRALEALVPEGAIGINLSPLVARFRSGADGLSIWRTQAVALVAAVADRFDRPIVLVPHVGAPDPADDDFAFLEAVRSRLVGHCRVPLSILPQGLGAAESKWMIARCSLFVGARTHATIAALSSKVPTLSLSYSAKAIGINDDLFGHHDFCLSVRDLAPEVLVAQVSRLLAEEDSIRRHLDHVVPQAQARALEAGQKLRDLVRVR